MSVKFGPAGQCDTARRLKLSTPQYLDTIGEMGLDAFEYQCGRGVNIGIEKAREIGERARKAGITLSLHAPYYISLASLEEQKRANSITYMLKSARVISAMGGTRVVVHPGGLNKQTREVALSVAKKTLLRAREVLDEEGLTRVVLCPETMGKILQLGDLEEVIELCLIDERMLPCIDFGHLNARGAGALADAGGYEAVLDILQNRLGEERARSFHAHFSKIEYSKGGEVRHLTFADKQYGPDFLPLLKLCVKRRLTPTIICESAGTQCEDANTMRKAYKRIRREEGKTK